MTSAPPSRERRRILVVEDDRVINQAVSDRLERNLGRSRATDLLDAPLTAGSDLASRCPDS